MFLHLSGWQALNYERETAVIKGSGYKARCFSFCNVVKVPGLPYFVPGAVTALDACVEHGIKIMLDSGVVGWRSYAVSCEKKGNKKALEKLCGEQEYIELYVDYVKKNSSKWAFYMSVDLERIAANIFERHKRILKMGINPVPVFHGDAGTDFIKKYADIGCKLLAIASWKTLRNGKKELKTYLEACFNTAAKCGMKLHGLAMTAPWMMMEHDWYSVDSSSWSRVAGFGGIMLFDENKNRLSNINISDRATSTENFLKLNPKALEAVKEQVEHAGFDFSLLRTDFVQRHIWNAKTMQRMADIATAKHSSASTHKWDLLF